VWVVDFGALSSRRTGRCWASSAGPSRCSRSQVWNGYFERAVNDVDALMPSEGPVLHYVPLPHRFSAADITDCSKDAGTTSGLA